MKIKLLILSLTIPLTGMALDNNPSVTEGTLSNSNKIFKTKTYSISSNDFKNLNFENIEPGLMRSERDGQTIEITYGHRVVMDELNILKTQLEDLELSDISGYEYEYKYDTLLNKIESLESSEFFNSIDNSVSNKTGGSTTVGECGPMLPTTQTYSFIPGKRSLTLSVQSEIPAWLVGPIPPGYAVSIDNKATLFTGASEIVDRDLVWTNNIAGGLASSNVSALGSHSTPVPYFAHTRVTMYYQGWYPLCAYTIDNNGTY